MPTPARSGGQDRGLGTGREQREPKGGEHWDGAAGFHFPVLAPGTDFAAPGDTKITVALSKPPGSVWEQQRLSSSRLCPHSDPRVPRVRALAGGSRAPSRAPFSSPPLPVRVPWQRGGPSGLQLHIPTPQRLPLPIPAPPGTRHGELGARLAQSAAPRPAQDVLSKPAPCSVGGSRALASLPGAPGAPLASLGSRPRSRCHRQCHPWICVPRAARGSSCASPSWVAPGTALGVAAALKRGLSPKPPLTPQN